MGDDRTDGDDLRTPLPPIQAPNDAQIIRDARQRYGRGGAMIAAAGLGLAELLEGRKKRDEGSVVVDAEAQPVDLDTDGFTIPVDADLSVAVLPQERRTPLQTPKRRRRGR